MLNKSPSERSPLKDSETLLLNEKESSNSFLQTVKSSQIQTENKHEFSLKIMELEKSILKEKILTSPPIKSPDNLLLY